MHFLWFNHFFYPWNCWGCSGKNIQLVLHLLTPLLSTSGFPEAEYTKEKLYSIKAQVNTLLLFFSKGFKGNPV